MNVIIVEGKQIFIIPEFWLLLLILQISFLFGD